jgi:DNA-directed RNA polymerase subunit L
MVEINRAWVERLHAPRYIWSQIAALNPKRGILCREEKSQQQLLTWNVETGETHALMPALDYQLNATLSQDGEFITYLVPHPTHADVYQYVRVPFGGGTPQPIAQTALMNASPHIEEAAGRIGFTAVTGNGYSVQVWTPDGKKPLFSYESEVLAYGPSLSFDGKIAVVATMQSPESKATHLEAYEIDTGAKISQLVLPDTPLEAVKFAPFAGDNRLLVQAREGLLTRPLIWDVASGEVQRMEGLDKDISYDVWDWMNSNQILLFNFGSLHLYDLSIQKLIWKQTYQIPERITLAYTTNDQHIVYHKDIEHTPFLVKVVMNEATEPFTPLPLKLSNFKQGFVVAGNGGMCWIVGRNGGVSAIIRILEDHPMSTLATDTFVEAEAWINQNLLWWPMNIWDIFKKSPTAAAGAITDYMESVPTSIVGLPLLTAHNMGAALALLTLHRSDPSIWAGGVVVRPILDWGHLYESVAPPEKAMMRLWFGGSPTEQPQAWRDASPLRQTKPLTVPVKLLYHPYDSLTPIQHVQTYAANNPMVELIDISRDMVGPAHEQQEKIITRMLEAGLPLLQKGT